MKAGMVWKEHIGRYSEWKSIFEIARVLNPALYAALADIYEFRTREIDNQPVPWQVKYAEFLMPCFKPLFKAVVFIRRVFTG